VKIISTHEQILDGHYYKGCVNPARPSYLTELIRYTKEVGKNLAGKGCRDRFAVDYISWPAKKKTKNGEKPKENGELKEGEVFVHDEWEWEIQAIEINLRHGATTGPASICEMLCDATLSEESGLMTTESGQTKCYVTNDNVECEEWKGKLTIEKVLQQVKEGREPFIWNDKSKTGTVFHLLGPLDQYGKVGITCVHDSVAQAHKLFDQVEASLHELAKSSQQQ